MCFLKRERKTIWELKNFIHYLVYFVIESIIETELQENHEETETTLKINI